jgi:predicted permease
VLLSPDIDGGIRSIAWLLVGVVGLILVVVCINLAGFLLARALDRRREIAMRLALGASRGALVRQLLTETILLSLLGGSVGYLLAVWLLRIAPSVDLGLGIALNPDLAPDSTVLVFTFGITLFAGALLGLVPALQSTRPDVVSTLKNEAVAGGQPSRQRWRNALIVTQLTVSLVILVIAGLFLRSLQRQELVDPGFGQDPTSILRVEVSPARFTPEQGRAFTRDLRQRFLALPGVGSVGLIGNLPLAPGRQWIDFLVDGHLPPEDQEVFRADYAISDGGFFAAAGIPILQGRAFTNADATDGERVVVVSEEMARRFWPNDDPIGQIVRMSGGSPALPGGGANLRVVGVARNIAWESLNELARTMVYVPYSQYYSAYVTFVAQTEVDADQTALALVAAGTEMDAGISVLETTTMARYFAAELRPIKIMATLLSIFAILVLLLAAIGLYGSVSYAVSTRAREVGIRMALGANASAIRWLLTAGGARLVIVGVVLGSLLSLPLNRLLGSLLFGVESLDAATFLGASLLLGATALLAAYLPARRASRVNPIAALRQD